MNSPADKIKHVAWQNGVQQQCALKLLLLNMTYSLITFKMPFYLNSKVCGLSWDELKELFKMALPPSIMC